MDYYSWVNSDFKRSVRYASLVEEIARNKTHLRDAKKHLQNCRAHNSVQRGVLDEVDFMLEKGWADSVQGSIASIERLKDELSEIEHFGLQTWTKMPRPRWGDELNYRLADLCLFVKDTRNITNCGHWTLARLNDWLGWLQDHYDIDFSLKSDRRCGAFFCKMSLCVSGQSSISVTRCAGEAEECLQRTLLTLLDLAWQYLIDLAPMLTRFQDGLATVAAQLGGLGALLEGLTFPGEA